MNRRTFIMKSGALVMLTPAATTLKPAFSGNYPHLSDNTSRKPSWLVELIRINDGNIRDILPYRISDTSGQDYGGFKNNVEIVNPHSTESFIRMAICAVTAPESLYYNDEELASQINDAILFLLKVQHDDGTIDLLTTNFHSPPDTAFIVKRLVPPRKILMSSDVPGKSDLLNNLQLFLQKAGEALVIGGIHTPNHRWVVCSALAWLYTLWPERKYLERAETWLAEGIDMDPDGQYYEKSTYIYSPLTNKTLISIAQGFDKPELLDYVRRNLEMTFYYVHPNGEVVTNVSGRQDRAIIGTLENYYYPYRFMAQYDGDGRYAAMCRLIEKTAFPKTVPYLYLFLEDHSLWKELPPSEALPSDYIRAFPYSGLVRVRRGDYDASIISGNPLFFSFHNGLAVLQGVRVASAFFGKGQFSSEKILKEEGKWILKSELQGPYYQPFIGDSIPGDGDWGKMPRNLREQSEVQHLETKVIIQESGKGFELTFNICGTDNVPVSVELIFRSGGAFSGVEPHDYMNDSYLLRNGYASYSFGGDVIDFGPGTHAHSWLQLRGALPKMDAPTVYLTGFTPFHKKIFISAG